jgi:hypothetical protein
MKKYLLALLLLSSPQAIAYEMLGLVGYDFNLMTNKPSNTVRSAGGIGYGFIGRLDLGPGRLETGFLYTPLSITTNISTIEVKTSGSYWIVPVLYRYEIVPPFLSMALGADYAIQGSTNIAANGSLGNAASTEFQNHFGLEASLEAAQDLGEDLSLVLDIRYRYALGDAITLSNQALKYNFTMVAIGFQKRLE